MRRGMRRFRTSAGGAPQLCQAALPCFAHPAPVLGLLFEPPLVPPGERPFERLHRVCGRVDDHYGARGMPRTKPVSVSNIGSAAILADRHTFRVFASRDRGNYCIGRRINYRDIVTVLVRNIGILGESRKGRLQSILYRVEIGSSGATVDARPKRG